MSAVVIAVEREEEEEEGRRCFFAAAVGNDDGTIRKGDDGRDIPYMGGSLSKWRIEPPFNGNESHSASGNRF